MSIRHAFILFAFSALALSQFCGPVMAQDEEEEVEEANLDRLVGEVKVLFDKAKAASAPETIEFPFGHYSSRVLIPTETISGEPEVMESQGPILLPEFSITGKMKMKDKIRIFIGRESYGVGDSLQGAEITKITNDTVFFTYGGQKFKKSIP